MSVEAQGTAIVVCGLADLVLERGVAALIGGEQVAVFRVADDEILAVQQLDPFSGAHVMSRGIVGTRGSRLTVASPVHKQVFDLRTGECLDPVGRAPASLRVWRARVGPGNRVLIEALPTAAPA